MDPEGPFKGYEFTLWNLEHIRLFLSEAKAAGGPDWMGMPDRRPDLRAVRHGQEKYDAWLAARYPKGELK
tara:strand:- start:53 stop:262 length:210 start_codon:yes stop_codon:yes gene_type:complete